MSEVGLYLQRIRSGTAYAVPRCRHRTRRLPATRAHRRLYWRHHKRIVILIITTLCLFVINSEATDSSFNADIVLLALILIDFVIVTTVVLFIFVITPSDPSKDRQTQASKPR